MLFLFERERVRDRLASHAAIIAREEMPVQLEAHILRYRALRYEFLGGSNEKSPYSLFGCDAVPGFGADSGSVFS